MDKVNIYYSIVPINNGYTYLCQDQHTSELYLYEKALGENPEALVFSSEQAAEEWIKLTRLSRERFKPEEYCTVNVIEKFSDINDLASLGYNFEVGM